MTPLMSLTRKPADDHLWYLTDSIDAALPASRRYSRISTRREFLLATMIGIAGLVVAATPLRFRDRFFPNTTVDGIDVSGMTTTQAQAELGSELSALIDQPLALKVADRTWEPTLRELGFSVNIDATMEAASAHGRSGGLLGRYRHALSIGAETALVPVTFDVNEDQLDRYLADRMRELGTPPQEASLSIEHGEIVLNEGVSGIKLDATLARDAILQAVRQNVFSTIELQAEHVEPSLSAVDLEPAWEHAQMLVSSPVRLRGDEQIWQLEPDDLLGALVLPSEPGNDLPSLDMARLAALLAPIAEQTARPAQNALLYPDGDIARIWEEGSAGRTLDIPAMSETIAKAVGTASSGRTVQLAFTEAQPDVRADTLAELGIARLLAKGGSSFQGSPDARRENVRVAAGHVSRTLIPPRGEWSFNKTLGAIAPENGYVEGHSIQGNWFADDIGGGVCQISTTVFRAALFAGFRFSEWHYHAFRVAFYELDGSPPGIDAAIFQPNKPEDQTLDLVIVNPTDSWAFIQTLIDGDRVTAELYGTPVDYETVVSPPKIGKPIPPPAPVTKVVATMAKDERELFEPARPGYDVYTTRRFLRGAEMLEEQTFASFYQPQPEMWLAGADTNTSME